VRDVLLALDEEVVILRVEDGPLDVVACEAANRFERIQNVSVTNSVRSPSSCRRIQAP